MRMIKTYEGMTMNCDVIATIQSVFYEYRYRQHQRNGR